MTGNEQDAETIPLETRSLVPGSLRLRVFLAVLLLLAAVVLLAWIQRVEIADSFVADYLAEQGVEAEYEIVDIGLQRQVLRNLTIGPEAQPDLVVEEMTITTRPALGIPVIENIRMRGVRIFGTYDGESVSLGALDPLVFTDSDAPFELPDFSVDIDDARVRMDTPHGVIGVSFNGNGHLKDGFEGELAAIAGTLDFGSCHIDRPSLFGTIRVESLEPIFSGPLRGTSIDCADFVADSDAFAFTVDLRADRTLADIELAVGGAASAPRYAGLPQGSISGETLLIDLQAELDGDTVAIRGETAIENMRSPWIDGREITLRIDSDPLALADVQQPDRLVAAVNADVALRGDGLAVDPAWNGLVADAVGGSPLAPLWRRAAPQLNARLSSARLSVDGAMAGGMLTLEPSAVKQDDGPVIARFSETSIALDDGAEGRPVLLAAYIVDRALPQIMAEMVWDSGSLAQLDLSMPSYAAGKARLAIDALRVRRLSADSYGLSGAIALSGPLPDGGAIDNLYLPLNGRLVGGNHYFARDRCQKLRFDALEIAETRTGKTEFSLCPVGRSPLLALDDSGVRISADIGKLALSGDLAGTPWAIGFEQMLLRHPGETRLGAVTAQIGEATGATRIAADTLTLDYDSSNGSFAGDFANMAATIGEVPLQVAKGEGLWSYDENGLMLASDSLEVSDRQADYRFNPLTGRGAVLRLADSRITVYGSLHEKQTGTRVSAIDIAHDLATARGKAVLAVKNLRFGPDFQPELITPLTLSVVANVDGRVDGRGEIRWNGDSVDSDGRFRTEEMDLAAAFGLVKGLAGEIVFSDLLAMATPPGQLVTMREVNPGVAANDGAVRYQLLPNQVMQIESGEWPFAGGRLVMEPATFNFAVEEEREVSFAVIGLDAAQFLSRFDFENISATGVFDGRLPMRFGQLGGNIEGGKLVVREGGGTLAYVGELTYTDLGSMANFAFDSLRAIRYRSLEIDMNGPLDGEMVTRINFSGLSQGEEASRNFVTNQIAKLPIQFNVTIRAPFFQLITSARSFYDTQYLPDIGSISRQTAPSAPAGEVSGSKDNEPAS
ncbi:MAG: YdbH domain-containing protein [Pseudomonadota bacterium]